MPLKNSESASPRAYTFSGLQNRCRHPREHGNDDKTRFVGCAPRTINRQLRVRDAHPTRRTKSEGPCPRAAGEGQDGGAIALANHHPEARKARSVFREQSDGPIIGVARVTTE